MLPTSFQAIRLFLSFDDAKLLYIAKASQIFMYHSSLQPCRKNWTRKVVKEFQYLLIGIFERNPSVKIAQFVFQVTIDVSRRLEIKASAGVV